MNARLAMLAVASLLCGCDTPNPSVKYSKSIDINLAVTKYELEGKTYLIFERGGGGIFVLEQEVKAEKE